jgi:uncharacterized protein YbjT (DUF2867 family)
MKIAITTPTGHVGSAVADFLLDFGGDVNIRLLGRRADRLAHLVDRGATAIIGLQDDADFLVKATKDVDALFWVTPPGYGSDNVRAFQNRFGKAGATAIRANKIPRVVVLSSIGANLSSGAGPISGLHDVEDLLGEVAPNITFLRPGFFFENLLWQLDSIKNRGCISLPLSGSRRYPMIATRDIGREAAARLSDGSWAGYHIRELHGPSDLCYDEVARILSDSIGRGVTYVRCERFEARQFMLESALSENAADLMLEMYDAIETGKLRSLQPRSAETTTSTTLDEFAREVLLPLVAVPVHH